MSEERRTNTRPTSGTRRTGDTITRVIGRSGPRVIERSGPRSFSTLERRRLADVTYDANPDMRAYDTPKKLKSDITRLTTRNPIGRANAGKYLRNKAVTRGLVNMTKNAGTGMVGRHRFPVGAGLIGTAAELGYGVLKLHSLKKQEQDAKLGTRMIKDAMKQRRKTKVLKMD